MHEKECPLRFLLLLVAVVSLLFHGIITLGLVLDKNVMNLHFLIINKLFLVEVYLQRCAAVSPQTKLFP